MDLYREIAEKKAAGAAFVVATIIRTAGSSPRRVGAKMLVYPAGTISGTIGGGKFEKLVISDALALAEGENNYLLKTYRFTDRGPEAIGMACGGEADVFFESFGVPEQLLIFGGGHIGRELVRLAQPLHFAVTVVDDRPEILNGYAPPVETIQTDPDYATNIPLPTKNSFVVLVTRGHRGDQAVLAQVINSNCTYLGMIGSRAKIAKVFRALTESGIDQKLLDRVHTPIGLDLGAEGPYEIAVSIIAEIIGVRHQKHDARQ